MLEVCGGTSSKPRQARTALGVSPMYSKDSVGDTLGNLLGRGPQWRSLPSRFSTRPRIPRPALPFEAASCMIILCSARALKTPLVRWGDDTGRSNGGGVLDGPPPRHPLHRILLQRPGGGRRRYNTQKRSRKKRVLSSCTFGVPEDSHFVEQVAFSQPSLQRLLTTTKNHLILIFCVRSLLVCPVVSIMCVCTNQRTSTSSAALDSVAPNPSSIRLPYPTVRLPYPSSNSGSREQPSLQRAQHPQERGRNHRPRAAAVPD